MKDFKELEVWRRAHELNHWVHALVDSYPSLGRHGLASQMRRASTDIARNIAQGCGSSGNEGAERWYFNAALGAAAALDYLMFLGFEQRLVPPGCAARFLEMKVEIQVRLRDAGRKETERRAPASLTLVQ